MQQAYVLQIHKLLEKNKNLSFKLTELETESKRRIDELTQELERQAKLVEQLRAQLQAQADYEDIKKELRFVLSLGEKRATWFCVGLLCHSLAYF